MTLDDLTHIFRFQITSDCDYQPRDRVDYVLLTAQDRVTAQHNAHDLASLPQLLVGFTHDGYRDRVPVFVKTDME